MKAVLVQMEIKASAKRKAVRQENISTLYEMLNQINYSNQLDLIVLPEEFLAGSGYGFISMPETMESLETMFLKDFRDFIRSKNVNAIVNVTVKETETKNRSFILNRLGETVDIQERQTLYEQERPYLQSGKVISAVTLDFGNISIINGLDLFNNQLVDKIVNQDVDMVISPTAFAVPNNDTTHYYQTMYKARVTSIATTKCAPVICANPVGNSPHFEGKWFGHSIFADSFGKTRELDDKSGHMIIEIDKGDAKLASTMYHYLFHDINK